MAEELWDVKDVARYLKLSERVVYDKARRGDLPSIRMGGRWRFRRQDIDQWLADTVRRPEGRSKIHSLKQGVPSRRELEAALAPLEDPIERRITFVALLTEACVARGWPAPVVVGGQAVGLYSGGSYATVDIDLVSASEPINDVLGEWGFSREGRHWFDDTLDLVVEAPGSRLEPGQREHLTCVQTGGHEAYVLGIEDVIVDRLAACVHWGSDEDCGWARILLRQHRRQINEEYLRQRAVDEKVADRLEEILSEGAGP